MMIPGEIVPGVDPIEIHSGRPRATLTVRNDSRWAVQIASHMHFFEVNRNLTFDRSLAFGTHLDIPAGRAVRWESGEQKEVTIVAFAGARTLFGFNRLCEGPATSDRLEECMSVARRQGFLRDER
jgi:urease beta subunit